MKREFFFLISITVLFACNNYEQKISSVNNDTTINESFLQNGPAVILSMPAPLQVAYSIKSENKDFYENLLEPTKRVENTALSMTKKAILLGILSVDLGYSITYNKQQNILNYLSNVKALSEELGAVGAFSPGVVKRLENNINNIDSLSYIILSSFDNANNYFNNNDRQETALLILTGGLLEGIYLSANIAKLNSSSYNKNVVAQQKFFLDISISLFNISEETLPDVKQVFSYLKELQSEFNQINIRYLETENLKNKVVESVSFSDIHLDKIVAKINEIHKSILQ